MCDGKPSARVGNLCHLGCRPGNWIHTGQGRGAYEKIEDPPAEPLGLAQNRTLPTGFVAGPWHSLAQVFTETCESWPDHLNWLGSLSVMRSHMQSCFAWHAVHNKLSSFRLSMGL